MVLSASYPGLLATPISVFEALSIFPPGHVKQHTLFMQVQQPTTHTYNTMYFPIHKM